MPPRVTSQSRSGWRERSLDILDQERERLGRELHDGLCQTLAGIAALSSALSRKLAASSNSMESAAAAEITKLLSESIGDARDVVRGLSPLGLHGRSLDEALDAFVENAKHLFSVTCTLECNRPFPRQLGEIETHLFRIAQEAVNNAITHGRAERIEISLSIKDEKGLLTIGDDGVGISDKTGDILGIGMHTMSYGARLIDAQRL